MRKFSEVSVLHRDAIVSSQDLIFYRSAPKALETELELRGNTPLSLTVLNEGRQLLPELSLLRFGDGRVQIDPQVFSDCEDNTYAVVVIRFSHGQSAKIPVFIEANGIPTEQRLFPLENEDVSFYNFPNGRSFGPFEEDGSLPLHYDFTAKNYGETARLKFNQPRQINIPNAKSLRVTIKGDGSYQMLSIKFNNGYNSGTYSENKIVIDFDDVRTVDFVLPTDAILPLNVSDVVRVSYTPGCKSRSGSLILYDVTVTSKAPKEFVYSPPPSFPLFPRYERPELPLGRSAFVTGTPSRVIRTVTEDPAHSAAFSCAVSEGEYALEYRVAGTEEYTLVKPVCEDGFEEEGKTRVPIRYHKFYLFGLQADTEYEYRIGEEVGGTFRTFPEAPQEFCAMFLADAQLGSDLEYYGRYRRVIEREIEMTSEPRFIMTLGDMVKDCYGCAEFSRLCEAAGEYFREIPIAPTIGNHERDVNRGFAEYLRRFALPEGAESKHGGKDYAFTVGDYTFFSVNAVCTPLDKDNLAGLERELKECTSRWKIVFLHCSPYTGQGSVDHYRTDLAPILERGGVDVVFSGHAHIYVRASVWEDKSVAPEDGIAYFTMGSTGRRLFLNDRRFWQDYVWGDNEDERTAPDGMSDQTCAVARFTPDMIELTVETISGKDVDRVVIRK